MSLLGFALAGVVLAYDQPDLNRLSPTVSVLWPDSFAQGPQGWIYVTTTQIHLPPSERGPYGIYRFQP